MTDERMDRRRFLTGRWHKESKEKSETPNVNELSAAAKKSIERNQRKGEKPAKAKRAKKLRKRSKFNEKMVADIERQISEGAIKPEDFGEDF